MASARRAIGAALSGLGAGIVQQAAQNRETQLMRLRRKWHTEDRDAAAALTREGWDRADQRAAMTAAGRGGGTDRLVEVYDPDTGQNRYMPSSQAAGMEPARKAGTTPRDTRKPLIDKITGEFMGYPPTAAQWEAQQQRESAEAAESERTAQVQARSEAAFENLRTDPWSLSGAWDRMQPGDSAEQNIGMTRAEFTQRFAEVASANPNMPDAEVTKAVVERFGKPPASAPAPSQPAGGGGGAGNPYMGEAPPAGFPQAQRLPDGRWVAPGPDGRPRIIID